MCLIGRAGDTTLNQASRYYLDLLCPSWALTALRATHTANPLAGGQVHQNLTLEGGIPVLPEIKTLPCSEGQTPL